MRSDSLRLLVLCVYSCLSNWAIRISTMDTWKTCLAMEPLKMVFSYLWSIDASYSKSFAWRSFLVVEVGLCGFHAVVRWLNLYHPMQHMGKPVRLPQILLPCSYHIWRSLCWFLFQRWNERKNQVIICLCATQKLMKDDHPHMKRQVTWIHINMGESEAVE